METQECILFIVAPDRVRRCQQYEIHLTPHVSVRYLLPILTKIWISSTDSHKSQKYKISRKSDQWEPRWHARTDGKTKGRMYGKDKANRRFSSLGEQA